MHRSLRALLVTGALLLLLAATAFAAKFTSISPTLTIGGELRVIFTLTGLNAGQLVTVRAQASTVEAEYACQNRGGMIPVNPDRRLERVGMVTASRRFVADPNGQVAGFVTLSPPAPALLCPPGQVAVVVRASYGDALLRMNGETASVRGPWEITVVSL